ncbi:hypothetical protein EXIGLDRAFT_517450 [Exidia glandulosa HHB12029]|uniref:Uncharacterized protein n=1 Tax=Exidia glandulosa HHB12029 TaxID=1314781 RepID=A0A165J8I9_EXIGL|nr:hypothetical protein EXIGLDRAFT_517450 [Exidia glandulosa HHB12029]
MRKEQMWGKGPPLLLHRCLATWQSGGGPSSVRQIGIPTPRTRNHTAHRHAGAQTEGSGNILFSHRRNSDEAVSVSTKNRATARRHRDLRHCGKMSRCDLRQYGEERANARCTVTSSSVHRTEMVGGSAAEQHGRDGRQRATHESDDVTCNAQCDRRDATRKATRKPRRVAGRHTGGHGDGYRAQDVRNQSIGAPQASRESAVRLDPSNPHSATPRPKRRSNCRGIANSDA